MFRDKLGTPIEAGDIIAYAVRSGNSGDIKVGMVLDVITGSTGLRYRDIHGEYHDTNATLKVRGYGSKRASELYHPDRIVYVDDRFMPEEVREELREYLNA